LPLLRPGVPPHHQ